MALRYGRINGAFHKSGKSFRHLKTFLSFKTQLEANQRCIQDNKIYLYRGN